MEIIITIVENGMQPPQKIKNRSYDPSIPLPGIFKGYEISMSQIYLHFYIHCSIFYNDHDKEST
jgi:hypothetical protein